ncbi:hypothetical protein SAMN04488052_1155 [Aquisalimonas asiatica]|uniref:Uncharacterized protein n=1 Tax=Aquisalimonas asiatica TaxID=406100 RepID=A0A1H8VTX6_9GAMM|nr:hypothetical protein SAMN04488052_1155 [Aquisalimonas asiatica]
MATSGRGEMAGTSWQRPFGAIWNAGSDLVDRLNTACHRYCELFAYNPGSGRVMIKAGMKREGELQDEIIKDGVFHNLVIYGLVDS